jgi:hypothetical protein
LIEWISTAFLSIFQAMGRERLCPLRLGLLREIIFPGRRYMLDAYGFPPGVLPSMLLPALYAHRIVFGLTKIIARRK